ncbi:hypothetical protein ABIE04_001290 [Rhodanobacter soli]|jgi:hypothetical protein|uniref:Uncharacterized protein n=1 Tax=Rhodanobacter soli TaxID=590609 RepID=A0ABV2PV95_9GAMM
MKNFAAQLSLLPLHAGGGWEGVKLYALVRKIKSEPLPNPPLQAGEGVQACRNRGNA